MEKKTCLCLSYVGKQSEDICETDCLRRISGKKKSIQLRTRKMILLNSEKNRTSLLSLELLVNE